MTVDHELRLLIALGDVAADIENVRLSLAGASGTPEQRREAHQRLQELVAKKERLIDELRLHVERRNEGVSGS